MAWASSTEAKDSIRNRTFGGGFNRLAGVLASGRLKLKQAKRG
jgi:hypothetical protein